MAQTTGSNSRRSRKRTSALSSEKVRGRPGLVNRGPGQPPNPSGDGKRSLTERSTSSHKSFAGTVSPDSVSPRKGQEKRTTSTANLPRQRQHKGTIQFRISKRGKPYANIAKIDIQSLMAVSQEWEIRPDFAHDPPFQILPVQTTTKGQDWEDEAQSSVTSIRVHRGEWEWFRQECRANGTSTCREIRKWIHLAKEEAQYPQSLRRAPGPGHVQEYVR